MERKYHIDLAKGIGILLVVFGHHDTILHPYIATFHMPLFFMLSGLFHPSTLSFSTFAKRRARQLIIPYFCFAIILFLFWLIVGKGMGMSSNQDVSVMESFMGIFTATRIDGFSNIGWGGTMWFLPCLFVVCCMYHLIASCSKKDIILFNIGSVLLGMTLMRIFHIRLPWSFITALIALPFYTFGNLFRQYILDTKPHRSNCKDIIILLTFSLTSYLLGARYGMINMVSNRYYNLFLFFVGGIAGSLVLINLLKFIKAGHWKLINFLGMNTLVILAFHLRAKSLIEFIYPKITHTAYDETNIPIAIISVVIEIVLCTPLIYIINRYFPFLVGRQKHVEKGNK